MVSSKNRGLKDHLLHANLHIDLVIPNTNNTCNEEGSWLTIYIVYIISLSYICLYCDFWKDAIKVLRQSSIWKKSDSKEIKTGNSDRKRYDRRKKALQV